MEVQVLSTATRKFFSGKSLTPFNKSLSFLYICAVFERLLPSGKIVFYYRTYDEGGKCTTARCTGQTTKAAAKAYYRGPMRQGRLSSQETSLLQINRWNTNIPK